MGTKQGDVLGRLPTEEEERKPQLGSVLASMTVAMAAPVLEIFGTAV